MDKTLPPNAASDLDALGVNESQQPRLGALITQRLKRRDALKGLAAASALSWLGSTFLTRPTGPHAAAPSSLTFTEVPHGLDTTHHVAPGYKAQVLIRNDFLAYMPLPYGSRNSQRGLLCCNHENTRPYLMFPGLTRKELASGEKVSREQAEIEMAAQGLSIVEVVQHGGTWKVVEDSAYNRRLSALSARFRIGGPAAGHTRMRTSADAEGKTVIGTMNNCAGGTTPWARCSRVRRIPVPTSLANPTSCRRQKPTSDTASRGRSATTGASITTASICNKSRTSPIALAG
jgi:hypothetical protein